MSPYKIFTISTIKHILNQFMWIFCHTSLCVYCYHRNNNAFIAKIRTCGLSCSRNYCQRCCYGKFNQHLVTNQNRKLPVITQGNFSIFKITIFFFLKIFITNSLFSHHIRSKIQDQIRLNKYFRNNAVLLCFFQTFN